MQKVEGAQNFSLANCTSSLKTVTPQSVHCSLHCVPPHVLLVTLCRLLIVCYVKNTVTTNNCTGMHFMPYHTQQVIATVHTDILAIARVVRLVTSEQH